MGSNTKNEAFISVNGRPVKKLKYIVNCVSEIIKNLQLKKKFILILDIEVETKNVDLNLSKEKDEVRFKNEAELLEILKTNFKSLITHLYESVRTVLPLSQNMAIAATQDNRIERYIEKSASKNIQSDEKQLRIQNVSGAKSQNVKKSNDKKMTKNCELPLVSFNKDKFECLDIIGQFNKGFIICQLKDEPDKLFVVDQHAADEKATFENLLGNYKLGKQVLSNPIQIEFTFSQSSIIETYEDIIRVHGYSMEKNSDRTYNINTFPSYRDVEFGIEDLYEFLGYLENNQTPENFIYKKIEEELASNACRYSIMIGSKLDMYTMTNIVKKLTKLDAPFNCPHGRPTVFEVNQTQSLDPKTELDSILYDYN